MTINYSLEVVETKTIILAVFRVESPNYRYLNTMLTVPSKYEFSSRQLVIKDTLRQHLIVSKNPSENLILIPKNTCKFYKSQGYKSRLISILRRSYKTSLIYKTQDNLPH